MMHHRRTLRCGQVLGSSRCADRTKPSGNELLPPWHRSVLIDNEETWLRSAGNLRYCQWNRLSTRTARLAQELSRSLCALPEADLERISEIPGEFAPGLNLKPNLHDAQAAAAKYLSS